MFYEKTLEPKPLTIKQAAAYLSRDPRYVREMILDGRLLAYDLSPPPRSRRAYRVAVAELEALATRLAARVASANAAVQARTSRRAVALARKSDSASSFDMLVPKRIGG